MGHRGRTLFLQLRFLLQRPLEAPDDEFDVIARHTNWGLDPEDVVVWASFADEQACSTTHRGSATHYYMSPQRESPSLSGTP